MDNHNNRQPSHRHVYQYSSQNEAQNQPEPQNNKEPQEEHEDQKQSQKNETHNEGYQTKDQRKDEKKDQKNDSKINDHLLLCNHQQKSEVNEKHEQDEDNDENWRVSAVELVSEHPQDEKLDNFRKIMNNNKQWARKCVKDEPNYFSKLVNVQSPKYLYIGCADSRVPANQIMGLKPGEVFVHRNIANIAPPSDINVLAVVQYAVEHLKVEQILISGHYGCGGVKAAFQQNDFGPLQSWLSHIRELRSKFRQSLIGPQAQKQKTLVQLNVRQQVINISRIPAVQKAWRDNRALNIHGVVYNLEDGILKDLGLTMSSLDDVPEEYRLAKPVGFKK